ncbi:hypothetical protein [Colwellia piezophila]|uniref:hypothetical protein n=1 Tax=Colwellia piezophila TaxID=211668 RepID=UPI000365078A|nr:hypothetical protein [Colwellia piezophila]
MRLPHLFIIFPFLLIACSQEHASVAITSDERLKQQIIASSIAIDVDNSGDIVTQYLVAFAKKLDKVRILGLGEQTHGAGSVFTLNT